MGAGGLFPFRRVLPLQPAADVIDALDEVVGRRRARQTGIGEGDLVGDDIVAEDHRHRAAVAPLDEIGAVERLGLDDDFVAIAGEAVHAQRVGQDALAAGHPLQAAGADHADHLLSHGAFVGPHAARRLAEKLGVERHAALHLGHGILPPAKRHAG